VKRTSYEVTHYEFFSNLPPLSLSYVQIFSAASCYQKQYQSMFSFSVRDQVSHSYKTTGKTVRFEYFKF